MISRYPLEQNGKRIWVEKPDMANGGPHFAIVGDQFIARGGIDSGFVGEARAMLFSTRELVDFAKAYFQQARA